MFISQFKGPGPGAVYGDQGGGLCVTGGTGILSRKVWGGCGLVGGPGSGVRPTPGVTCLLKLAAAVVELTNVLVFVWTCDGVYMLHRELSQQGAECSLIGEHIRLT